MLLKFSADNSREIFRNFSYLVLIATYAQEKSNVNEVCAGILISNSFVLTSAFCYNFDENWAIIYNTNKGYKVEPIFKWILHPHYLVTPGASYNDIALVQLETSLKLYYYNIKPFDFTSVPEESKGLEHYINCITITWLDIDPLNITLDTSSEDFNKQTAILDAVKIIPKQFYATTQCDSLIKLEANSLILLDNTLLCVRQNEKVDQSNQGLVGSPLMCRGDADELHLHAIKTKTLEASPAAELFVKTYVFDTYLRNAIANPSATATKYFCGVQVCGKKHNVYGDYCVDGDDIDCYNEELRRIFYFPKRYSAATATAPALAYLCLANVLRVFDYRMLR